MKLSMWNLFYDLSEEDKVPLINVGSPTIISARWIVSSYLNPDMVYVGNESEYFDKGSDSQNTLIVHRHDMIVVRDTDPEEIFAEICSIIERYEKWEEKLKKCLKMDNGLTAMIDCSREFIKNPSYIYAPDGRALAFASGFPKDINSHWRELLENNGLTDDRMEYLKQKISLSNVFQDMFPTIRISSTKDYEYAHVSLVVNGYMAGHYVIFGWAEQFNEGLVYIMDNLADYLNLYISEHYAEYSATTKMGNLIVSLIFHEGYEEREFEQMLHTLFWNRDDEYRFFIVKEKVEKEPVLLAKLYVKLSEMLSDSVVFMVDDQLVILENQSRNPNQVIEKKHLASILKRGFICGISNTFSGLEQCDKYFMQAEKELEYCIRNSWTISRAEEHGLEYFKNNIKKDKLGKTYIYSDLIRLKKYDQENETSYYITLKTWFYCGFHMATTAKKLGIHRNSLSYRLERLRELLDFEEIDRLIETRDIERLNYYYFSFLYLDL